MHRSAGRSRQTGGTLARVLALGALLAVCIAGPSGAAVQVGQENAGGVAGAFQILFSQQIGQEFVPTFAEHLGVEVLLVDTNDTQAAPDITLNLRSDSIAGGILASVMATPLPLPGGQSQGFVPFDFASPVFLTPGQTYVIELLATSSRGSWAYTTGDGYPSGEAILQGSPLGSGFDFQFRTIINTPEPSPVLLVGVGLLVLAARPAIRRPARGESR